MMKKNEKNKISEEKNQPAGGEEIKNIENQLKRALADYQNLEKRIAEEKGNWIKMASQDLILRLLPTLDHLETALKRAKESGDNSSWVQGIEMAVREFRKVLAEEGLGYVQTEIFDPNFHEAVEVREGVDGSILDVLQMGYTLNGKLIRPAKVVVGSSKQNNN